MKKFTSFLLVLLITVNIFAFASFNAFAETDNSTNDEIEPNNIFEQAQEVSPSEVVHGSITDTDIVDFYKITLTERTRVTVYTLGTHVENYYVGDCEYDSWIYYEALAFSIYKENKPDPDWPYHYTRVNKKSCYYDYNSNSFHKYNDFEVEYDGFKVDNELWEQKEDMVLNKGTYYFAFRFDSMNKHQDYKFMYKLSAPIPAVHALDLMNFDKTFDADILHLDAGDIQKFRVIDGDAVSWISKNPKIAKIGKKGKVTALSKGKANIAAVLSDGKVLNCRVFVDTDPVLKVDNKKVKSINIKQGEKATVTIKGKAYNIKNKYTNTSIAKVISDTNKEKIKIKGLKKGTTTLKVKVNNVKTLSLKVTVS